MASDNTCARCGGAFHCGIEDAAPCACRSIKLDAALLAALRSQFHGCLCLACLGALAPMARPAQSSDRPGPERPKDAALRRPSPEGIKESGRATLP